MRKIYVFGLLAMMMAGMSSCTQTKVVDSTNWKIVDCNIGYSQWRYTGDEAGSEQHANNYYYAAYNVPDLSKFIFTDGNVQVYMVYTNSYGEEVQRQLPYVNHCETFIKEGSTIKTLYYTETYDFIYGNGWVEFDYRVSDFAYEDSYGTDPDCHPKAMKFRVVMTW